MSEFLALLTITAMLRFGAGSNCEAIIVRSEAEREVQCPPDYVIVGCSCAGCPLGVGYFFNVDRCFTFTGGAVPPIITVTCVKDVQDNYDRISTEFPAPIVNISCTNPADKIVSCIYGRSTDIPLPVPAVLIDTSGPEERCIVMCPNGNTCFGFMICKKG